jgi:hypothetical protein
LLLQHREGRCPALLWQEKDQRYGCGLVIRPVDYLPWLPQALIGLTRLFAKRWIAAGIGCDCDAEPEVSSFFNKETER